MEYRKLNEERGRCLECGDPIRYGRQGRKFCSPQCKNSYNNRKGRDSRNVRSRVRNALDKNYAILRSLVRMHVESIDLLSLTAMGFNENLVTSYSKSRCHTLYMCYDIKYFKSDMRIYSIEKVSSVKEAVGVSANL